MLDLNIENINLWKVTSDMEVLLINLADRKNISITNKIPPDILVDADKVTIQTVIRNLISNAIKFTPEGGNIVIKSKISNKQVILSITDSGPGIKLEDQEKILSEKSFTNFGTNNEKGSGLGLLLCKELVEKNKGKLWFESTEGKGTKFSFTIPLIKRTN
jgi:two-component system sensor histidine kinase/response regulator